jgi:hypothetical protein
MTHKIRLKEGGEGMKKSLVIIIALLISVVFISGGFAQDKAAPATPAAATEADKIAVPEVSGPEKKIKKTKKTKKPKKSKKSKSKKAKKKASKPVSEPSPE